VDEYKVVGIEPELSGICPHPSDDSLYYVAANAHPNYTAKQTAVLPAHYRGKLLTVKRKTGAIVRSFKLVGGDYGGVAYGDGYLWVSSVRPPEILKVNPNSGDIEKHIPLSGPAGGLEYDAQRGALLAQLYVGHPHLAVIDAKSGATTGTLWSDESAMDLAMLNGQLLCTWVSGFGENAFSELRLIDNDTGKVRGRVTLDVVHTVMKVLNPKVAGTEGFISMASINRTNGKVAIRKYSYQSGAVTW